MEYSLKKNNGQSFICWGSLIINLPQHIHSSLSLVFLLRRMQISARLKQKAIFHNESTWMPRIALSQKTRAAMYVVCVYYLCGLRIECVSRWWRLHARKLGHRVVFRSFVPACSTYYWVQLARSCIVCAYTHTVFAIGAYLSAHLLPLLVIIMPGCIPLSLRMSSGAKDKWRECGGVFSIIAGVFSLSLWKCIATLYGHYVCAVDTLSEPPRNDQNVVSSEVEKNSKQY